MLTNLSLFKWSTANPKGASTPAKGWTLDRNWDRAEGERLLKAKSYVAAETLLSRAVVEAEARGRSAAKRIHLRLLLAEAQRHQFRPNADEPDVAKLAAAEQTVRFAIQIAAKNAERDLYIQCLDALAEIFADQGKFDAVEKVMEDAIRIES